MEIVLEDGMVFPAERLEREPWLAYLYYTENHGINMEREILNSEEKRRLVALLIRTHGLIGQALRGEVLVKANAPLAEVANLLGTESAYRVLSALNHCIIGGVRLELWEQVKDEAMAMIRASLIRELAEFSTRERMKRLDERLSSASEEIVSLFETQIFPKYELWYYQAALADFGIDHVPGESKATPMRCRNNSDTLPLMNFAISLKVEYILETCKSAAF